MEVSEPNEVPQSIRFDYCRSEGQTCGCSIAFLRVDRRLSQTIFVAEVVSDWRGLIGVVDCPRQQYAVWFVEMLEQANQELLEEVFETAAGMSRGAIRSYVETTQDRRS